MTDDLTKTFFETFGIEPKYKTCIFNYCKNKKEYDCENCDDKEWHYPQITDRILLELFDILRKCYNLDFWTIDNSFVMDMRDKSANYTSVLYRTGGDLKHSILSSLQLIVNQKLNYNEKIKQQVQALFKEE